MEIWVPVKGYEGLYEVSTEGRVRSLDRVVQHRKNGPTFYAGRICAQTPGKRGYVHVSLSKNGKTHTANTHALVADHFLVKPEGVEEVRHQNGNRADPRLDNLVWGTRRENQLDRWDHGTGRNQHGPWKNRSVA